MFFLPSSFRILPPLKNDGRGELRFLGSKYLPVILERSEEFGQRVQDLTVLTCVHTCLYRLARLGTSLRIRGKLTLRKKGFIVLQNGVICL